MSSTCWCTSRGSPPKRRAPSCGPALRLAPNDADLHGNVGVALGTLGKYPEAVVALQAAIRLRPDLIAAHNNLAQILRSLGKNLEAAHHYDEAERLRQQASRPR